MTIGQTELCGASDAWIRHNLIGLAEHNAIWFAGPGRVYRPFPEWSIKYRPDPPSDILPSYDAPTLHRVGIGSCGVIAAAMYGWLRGGMGEDATFLVRRVSEGEWHGLVRTARGLIWDPIREVEHG